MAKRAAEKERLRDERLQRERDAERAGARRRRAMIGAGVLAAAVAVIVVAALLADGNGESSGTASGGPAQAITDVHGIGVNPADGALYIASHTGLFRSPKGEATATRVEAPEQDLMGFSIAGPDRFFASGHPGAGQGGPSALGLIESRDRGATWKPVSLPGSDLHLLRAAGDAVYTFDGELQASRDGGRTFQQRESPGALIDMAIDPSDADRVLASTESGVRITRDGGRTWQDTALGAPALLAWGQPDRPAAIGGDGTVQMSTDGGRTWKPAGSSGGQPAAFAGDDAGALYVAGPDGSVTWSSDGGRTWRPRSRN